MAKKTKEKKKAEPGDSPFDYISAVSSSVENKIANGELPASKINRYMLVRGFAGHSDTVLLANEANKMSHVPDSCIFHFLHGVIQPKRNRFGKWPKPDLGLDEEKISAFVNKHECSRSVAIDAINFLEAENNPD